MLYTLIVRTRDKSLTLGEIDLAKEKTTLDADGFLAEVEVKNIGEITRCDIKLSGSEPSYASIRMCYDEGEIYTYSGKRCECETFRQSPHNPNNHAFAEGGCAYGCCE